MLTEVSHLRFFNERTVDVRPDSGSISGSDGSIQKYGGSFHFFVHNRKRTIIWKICDSHILTLCEVAGGKTKTVQLRFQFPLLPYVYFSQDALDVHVYCLTPPVFHQFTLSLPKNSVGNVEKFSYLSSLCEVNEYHHRSKSIPTCVNVDKFVLLSNRSFAFLKEKNQQELHIVQFDSVRLDRYVTKTLSDLTFFNSFFRWNAAGERYVDLIVKHSEPNIFLFVLTDHLNVKIFEITKQKFISSFSFFSSKEISNNAAPRPESVRFCHKPLQSHIRDGNLFLVCYYYLEDSQDAAFRILEVQSDGLEFRSRTRRPLEILTGDRELVDYKISGDNHGDLICLWRCAGDKDGFPYYDVNIGKIIRTQKNTGEEELEWARITTIWDRLREEMGCYPENPDLLIYQYPDVITDTLKEYYGCSPDINNLSDFEIREQVRDHILKQTEHKYPNRELEPSEMEKIRDTEIQRFWKFVLANWMKKYRPFAIYTLDNELGREDDLYKNELQQSGRDGQGGSSINLDFFRTNFGLLSTMEMRVLRRTGNFVELLYKNNVERFEKLIFFRRLLSEPNENCIKKSFQHHHIGMGREDGEESEEMEGEEEEEEEDGRRRGGGGDEHEGVDETIQNVINLLECVELFSWDFGSTALYHFDLAMNNMEGGKSEEQMEEIVKTYHRKLIYMIPETKGEEELSEFNEKRKKFLFEMKQKLQTIPNVHNVVFLINTILNYLWETPEYENVNNVIQEHINQNRNEEGEVVRIPHFLASTNGYQPLLYETTRQLVNSEYGFLRDFYLFLRFVSLNFRYLFITGFQPSNERNRIFRLFHSDLDDVIKKTGHLLTSYYRVKWLCTRNFELSTNFFLALQERQMSGEFDYPAKSAIDLIFHEELITCSPYMNLSFITDFAKQMFSYLMFCRTPPQNVIPSTIISPEELEHLKRFIFGLLKFRQVDLLQQYCRMFRHSSFPFFLHFLGVTYIHQRKIEHAKDYFERVKQHLFEQSLRNDDDECEDEDEENEGEDDDDDEKSGGVKPSWTYVFFPPSNDQPKQETLIKTSFDYYYFLVTSVFPEQPELVHHFGTAALLEIQRNVNETTVEDDLVLREAVSILLSKLFVVNLSLGRFSECLRFIVQMKLDPQEQENNLSLLMTNMIENGKTTKFIQGWTQASHSVETGWSGDGEAVLPSPQVGRVLWKKARMSEVLAKIGKVRLYEILFSFFFHRKMYDRAAYFMYEYSRRILKEQIQAKFRRAKPLFEDEMKKKGKEGKKMKDEDDDDEEEEEIMDGEEELEAIQEARNEIYEKDETLKELERQNIIKALRLRSNGLSNCLCALSVTNPDTQYIIYKDIRDEGNPLADEIIISLEDLEKEYVSNEVYLKLLVNRRIKTEDVFSIENCERILRLISASKYPDLACTFAEKFGLDIRYVFRGLAKNMIRISRFGRKSDQLIDEDADTEEEEEGEEEEEVGSKNVIVRPVSKDFLLEKKLLELLEMYPERENYVEVFETIMRVVHSACGSRFGFDIVPDDVVNWLDRNGTSELLRMFLNFGLINQGIQLVRKYVEERRMMKEQGNDLKDGYVSPNFIDILIFEMKRRRYLAREISDLERSVKNIL